MSQTLQDLDITISSLLISVGQLVNDVTGLIQKIQATPSAPDFSAEVDQVNSAIAQLTSAHAAAGAILNPTPSVAPAQAPQGPVTAPDGATGASA
jgi:hypothetical protein